MQPLDPITGRALQVAQDLGVVHLLQERPRGSEEVASETGCAYRGMEALLALLASAGYLTLEKERFGLAPGLLEYLRDAWPAEWNAFPTIPEYEELEKAVRTGGPVRRAVEGTEDGGEFYSTVTPALFELHWPDAQALSERIDAGVHRVLDLGAGSAVWSLPLAVARPEVRVVAVDRARVLSEVTTGFLQRHEVAERYELRAGDYHEVELEEGGYELVLLGHLLHADGWEGSRQLLARCQKALAPGGKLAVAEFVAPEPRHLDYAANVFHLNMVMLTEQGVVFTAAELEKLARESGFQGLEWIQGPGNYPLLLATNL